MDNSNIKNISGYCKTTGITAEEFIWRQDELRYDYEYFLSENGLDNCEDTAIEFLANYEYSIDLI
jgi:hypothetical protein